SYVHPTATTAIYTLSLHDALPITYGSISKTCKYNHRNTWWNNDTDSRRCCGNPNCCFFIITFAEHTWNKDFPYSCCICLCCSRYTSKHHRNEHIRMCKSTTNWANNG